jgi:beta-glucosidase
MTLDKELVLMHGVGQQAAPSGSIGATAPIAELGIPALDQQDGPAGIGDRVGGVTQLPAPEALAATFDPAVAACYGQVIGAEARAKGFDLVYGPTINIVRVPTWGRAFESLGEDPVLAGSLGTAVTQGIQSTGTMAQLKHYAVYNQETSRLLPADDAVVGPQPLAEIYLRAFDQVVAEAHPASVMCSYSSINGTNACQSSALIRDHLDGTDGYDGFVGSDYYGTLSTAEAANAGLDQEQPASTRFGDALAAAVASGAVPKATIDEAVTRILTQMYRFRLMTEPATGSVHDDVATADHAATATAVAEESTTLLRNEHDVLPLRRGSGGSIAVIGPAAQDAPVQAGGGSATVVSPADSVTPLAAIRAAAGPRRPVTYVDGLPTSSELVPIPATARSAPTTRPDGRAEVTLTAPQTGRYELAFSAPPIYRPATLYVDDRPLITNPGTPPNATYVGAVQLVAGQRVRLSGAVDHLTWATPDVVQHRIDEAVAAARTAGTAVVVVGDAQESEASDRVSLALPGVQDQLIEAVAAANPRTVVVVHAGGPVTMPWLSDTAAVLDAWYPGQANGTALAAVLFGTANPSGHLPMSFPASEDRGPVSSTAQFPGTGTEVQYSEGVDVGYRWYDATGTAPLFPFGFGLSYTTFRFGAPSVSLTDTAHGPEVRVTVRVTNTGRRSGADVVQLYAGEPAAAHEPPRQLEAFRRVDLAAGASTKVTFTLRGRQLAAFDPTTSTWRIVAGDHRVWVGDSSGLDRLPARATVRIAHTTTVQ